MNLGGLMFSLRSFWTIVLAYALGMFPKVAGVLPTDGPCGEMSRWMCCRVDQTAWQVYNFPSQVMSLILVTYRVRDLSSFSFKMWAVR